MTTRAATIYPEMARNGGLRFWDPVAGGWLLRRDEECSRAEVAETRVMELEAELCRLRAE